MTFILIYFLNLLDGQIKRYGKINSSLPVYAHHSARSHRINRHVTPPFRQLLVAFRAHNSQKIFLNSQQKHSTVAYQQTVPMCRSCCYAYYCLYHLALVQHEIAGRGWDLLMVKRKDPSACQYVYLQNEYTYKLTNIYRYMCPSSVHRSRRIFEFIELLNKMTMYLWFTTVHTISVREKMLTAVRVLYSFPTVCYYEYVPIRSV